EVVLARPGVGDVPMGAVDPLPALTERLGEPDVVGPGEGPECATVGAAVARWGGLAGAVDAGADGGGECAWARGPAGRAAARGVPRSTRRWPGGAASPARSTRSPTAGSTAADERGRPPGGPPTVGRPLGSAHPAARRSAPAGVSYPHPARRRVGSRHRRG